MKGPLLFPLGVLVGAIPMPDAAGAVSYDLDFSSSSQYDSLFREIQTNGADEEIAWDPGGFIRHNSGVFVRSSAAILDSSASGGSGGLGGETGSQANNDYQSFVIQADWRDGTFSNGNTFGFYTGVPDNDGSPAYLGTVQLRADSVLLRVDEGTVPSGMSFGVQLGNQTIPGTFHEDTWYQFRMEVISMPDRIDFNLGVYDVTTLELLASYSVSDTVNPVVETGQVGFRVGSNSTGCTDIDNFRISPIPEPGAPLLFGTATLLVSLGRRRYVRPVIRPGSPCGLGGR